MAPVQVLIMDIEYSGEIDVGVEVVLLLFCPDGPCCKRREDLECNDLGAVWIELGSSKKKPLAIGVHHLPPSRLWMSILR